MGLGLGKSSFCGICGVLRIETDMAWIGPLSLQARGNARLTLDLNSSPCVCPTRLRGGNVGIPACGTVQPKTSYGDQIKCIRDLKSIASINT
jgi:hypothetical protein